MKRKLALLLAGCLAISPAAAGLYPVQAFAAEAGVESKPGGQRRERDHPHRKNC